MEQRHYARIAALLSPWLSPEEVAALPRRYECVGDIILLSLPPILHEHRDAVAKAYYDVLAPAAVMEKAPVQGEYRQPGHTLLCGSRTTTVHRENGVAYELDLSRLMFSAGNIAERIRMAHVPDRGLTLDMFAGIGYFSLPIAKHAHSRVIALEKNPVSFGYLCKNIARNRLEGRVTPLNIDCRNYVGPPARRIIMGYVHTTDEYLPAALSYADERCLLHFHQTVPHDTFFDALADQILPAANSAGVEAHVIGARVIKKYAPGVVHAVADVELTKHS